MKKAQIEKQQQDFVEKLKEQDGKIRPKDFEDVYDVCLGVTGLYNSELKGIWGAFDGDLSDSVKSIVEIGRWGSGTLYTFCCLFKNLENVISIDNEPQQIVDPAIKRWLDNHRISHDFVNVDSSTYKPDKSGFYDFVFIDGNHDGKYVEKDILIWKDRCSYIGFQNFANRKGKNRHRIFYEDLVILICRAWEDNGWIPIGRRGRSEIIFYTGISNPNNPSINDINISSRVDLSEDKITDNLVGTTIFKEDSDNGVKGECDGIRVVAVENDDEDIYEDALDANGENVNVTKNIVEEDIEDIDQKEIDEETAEEDAERKAPTPEWTEEEAALLEKNPYLE